MVSLSIQFVHLELKMGDSSFFFTACYARPQVSFRKMLWDELVDISSNMMGAWCIAGDFNVILDESERYGGHRRTSPICGAFGQCVQNCELKDLGFQGPSYTWKHGQVRERLDRALCNNQWQVQT